MDYPDLRSIFKEAQVLVTGGLGFLGANLAGRLVGLGARVRLLDCLIPQHGGSAFNIGEIEDRVQVIQADLRSAGALTEALAGAQFVFNLAGQSSHWDSMTDPQSDLELNCRSHLNLLEALRQIHSKARVVLASTRQVYGAPKYLPVDEQHPLQPVDINGIHKVASEQYHQLYDRVYSIPCTILRLTNTIGPRMRIKDARQTFAGFWIRRAVEGVPFEVWGGSQLRDFNFVDDVVEALLRAAAFEAARGQVYNLGSTPVSLLEFAQLLRDVTGCQYRVKDFPADRKQIDIGDYHADSNRIRRELGWESRTPLRQAVERTVEYYREHGRHYV